VRLAVGRVVNNENATGPIWRAGGLMVQFMPTSPERMRQADLHPGDAPDDADLHQILEDDAWIEAQALVETIEDHELIDPTLESESLLYRLFHENGVRVFDNAPVYSKCRCSRERILDMLQSFPEKERRDMIADDGAISVTCEFCSTRYEIAPDIVGL
jgi:molecular chaperone Hsp33